MIAGHVASALAVRRHAPEMPWLLLLGAAMLPDLLMFSFVGLGIETLELVPAAGVPGMFSARTDMTFSHNLVPHLYGLLFFGAAAFGIFRRWQWAAWIVVLAAVHYLCDLGSGYRHFVFGHGTAPVGLGLYDTSYPAAIAIEAVFGAACAAWFGLGARWSPQAVGALAAVFALLPLALLLT